MTKQHRAMQVKTVKNRTVNNISTKSAKAERLTELQEHSQRRQAKSLYGWVFAVTLGLLLIMFISREIYPFGDNVFRYTDGDQNFGVLGYVQSTLFSSNNLLYTWGSVLGGNMIPILAYYAASPFNLLTILFPGNLMLAYHIILMVKFLAAGLSFAVMLERIFPTSDIRSKVIFASSYPFIGFMTYFIWNQSWMDGVIMLPLIALGIWLILKERKALMYTVALAVILISNYYIGYIICIASILFFICGAILLYQWNSDLLRVCGWYATATVAAAGIAAVILIPVYLSLPTDRLTTATELWENIYYLSRPEEVLSMLYTDPLDNIDFSNNYPIIYTGIVQFVLVIIFFLNQEISNKVKAIAGILLSILMLSFMISILNIAWHGFTSNLWYNFRYSFVASFILEFIAFYSFVNLKGTKGKLFAAGSVAALITVLALGAEKKNIGAETLMFDALWILLSLIALGFYVAKLNLGKSASQFFCFLLIAALVFSNIIYNTYKTTDGIGDWYADRNGLGSMQQYEKALTHEQLIKTIIDDPGLYRRASTERYGRTDALLFNYAGVENYASSENNSALTAVRKFGMSQDWYWALYNTNMPIAADALLGIKYIILGDSFKTDYLDSKGQISESNLTIWENPFALPLIFVVESIYSENDESLDTLNLLNACWNSICAEGGNIFEPATYSLEQTPVGDGTDVLLKFQAKSDGPVYAYIPAGDYRADISTWTHHQDVLGLGNYASGQEGEILLHMGQSYDDVDRIRVYSERIDILADKADFVQQRAIATEKLSSSRFKLQYTADSNELIASTIPFDDGWHVYLDGNEIEVTHDMNWFLAFNVPEGTHIIELVYWPPGFSIGATISALSILIVLTCTFRRQIIEQLRRLKTKVNA